MFEVSRFQSFKVSTWGPKDLARRADITAIPLATRYTSLLA
jgi:hypothetical protein